MIDPKFKFENNEAYSIQRLKRQIDELYTCVELAARYLHKHYLIYYRSYVAIPIWMLETSASYLKQAVKHKMYFSEHFDSIFQSMIEINTRDIQFELQTIQYFLKSSIDRVETGRDTDKQEIHFLNLDGYPLAKYLYGLSGEERNKFIWKRMNLVINIPIFIDKLRNEYSNTLRTEEYILLSRIETVSEEICSFAQMYLEKVTKYISN